MPYTPHTDADRRAMLAASGVSSVEELFHDVPAAAALPALKLPQAVSEMEILDELYALALKKTARRTALLPSWAPALTTISCRASSLTWPGEGNSPQLTRLTSRKVSQGTLQAAFEYQSMVAALTGMDVVNASHYDGATSMAEAALMAINVTRGKRCKIVVSPWIHPSTARRCAPTWPATRPVVTGDEDLHTGLDGLKALLDDNTACLIIQNPNFFGELLDVDGLADAVHAAGALLVVVANPIISLGLLRPPGDYGADIVVAEGQPLGAGLNFGGPYLGIFAAREEYVRKAAGPPGGRNNRHSGPARLRADPDPARAAHPPREGDQQTSAPTRAW